MKKPTPTLTYNSEAEFYAGIRAANAGEPRPPASQVWQRRGWDFVEDKRALDRMLGE